VTVYTIGVWSVRPGREEEFVREWDELAQWTVESGHDSHLTLVRDHDDPHRYVSLGPWPSAELAGRWQESEGFRERFARLEQLVESFEPQLLDVVMRVG
jgi:heme-degrading monooxygenase HmoA